MNQHGEWPELRGIGDGIPPAPGREIVRSVLLRSVLEGGVPPPGPRPMRARALLWAEARVVPRAVWLASALVMAAGVGFVLAQGHAAEPVMALVVPLVTGIGMAGVYPPTRDEAFEVVAVTPTSPRVLLLARMTLVLGYDLALALLASAGLSLTASTPAGLGRLIMVWLGPMALLAALGLLLSVCWNPEGAIGVALVAWILYALTFTPWSLARGVRVFWAAEPVTLAVILALAAVLGVAAVIAAGRNEPIRRTRATHWS
ncbi:hypothetical protein AB0B89_13320 [Sphaerisporangium sp. NPDC049002]|uniref:hypothetical protein n=1 Tax=unclassified Sphaerisporangium TaxID=2630420 RepID=UPI0033F2B0BB